MAADYRGGNTNIILLFLFLIIIVISRMLVLDSKSVKSAPFLGEFPESRTCRRVLSANSAARKSFAILDTRTNVQPQRFNSPSVSKNRTFIKFETNGNPDTRRWTNYNTSKVVILGKGTITIKLGDIIRYMIFARDARGVERQTGGDFWLVTFTGKTEDGFPVSAPPRKIVDHQNGSYSIYFAALWTGRVQIQVILLHPAEVVAKLRQDILENPSPPIWHGVYLTGKKNEVLAQCGLINSTILPIACIYYNSHALANHHLVCNPNESIKCEDLIGLKGMTAYGDLFMKPSTSQMKTSTWLSSQYLYNKLEIVSDPVTVSTPADSSSPQKSTSGSYLFHLDGQCKGGHVRGYWLSKRWHNVNSNTDNMNSTELQNCLRRSSIILSGDSTTRQWFSRLTQKLNISHPRDKERLFHARRQNFEYDIDITFTFHALSMHPYYLTVNFSETLFEVDVIFQTSVELCDRQPIVVIGPWAHLAVWPWLTLLDYARGLRRAIITAKHRCPSMRVFLKSPRPAGHHREMPGRDWKFYQIMKMFHDTLVDVEIILINVWDITLSSPFSYSLHMPDEVIDAELSLFTFHLNCSHQRTWPLA